MKTTLRSKIGYLLVQGMFFVFLFVIVTTVVIGFVPVKHRILTDRAISFLRESGADSCSIQSVEVVAWRSIRLQGLSFRVKIDEFRQYDVRVSDAILPVNILQLLLKRRQIGAVFSGNKNILFDAVLSKPHIIAEKVLTLGGSFRNGLQGTFNDVWVTIKTEGKTAFLGAGGRIEISPFEGNNNEVLLQAKFPIVTIFGDGMQNVRFAAMLTSDGQLSIGDFSASYFDGKIKGKGDIALYNDTLPSSFTVLFDKFDFAYWYALHVGVGKVAGSATAAFRGENIPINSLLRRLTLSAVISDCDVTDLPLQSSLATSLFVPSLSSLTFKKLSMRLKRNSADTIIASIQGSGNQINFMSQGWILENGLLQQSIEGALSAEIINSFSPDLQKTIFPGQQNDWEFRCRLYGSFDDPRFELDQETLQRAVGGIFNSLQQDIFKQLMK